MSLLKRSAAILVGRILLFIAIATFFWIPMIRHYTIRYRLLGGSWWEHIHPSQFDWLLIGVFFFMTAVCVFTIDLRKNLLILLIAALGGLSIEGWGTQTELWRYYTRERPPLWIIPAWPTAALTIDSLSRIVDRRIPRIEARWWNGAAWALFGLFLALMVPFTRPYISYSMTMFSIAVIALVIVSIWAGTADRRTAVVIFVVGSALGWFLELWGTTRHCWIYYTRQEPPLFAVLAHGAASVTFWRAHLIADGIITRLFPDYQGHWSRGTVAERSGSPTPR